MFNLSNKYKQVKDKIKPLENDLILVIVVILVALISFGLGRLSKIRENKPPIKIENNISNVSDAVQVGESDVIRSVQGVPTPGVGEKLYVASKNGTKYHYPWCSGASNIKEENKIWFSTKEEAEKSGYTPASNCKGL